MINLKHLFLIIQFLIVLCGCNASTDYVPQIGRLVRPQMQTLAAERRNGYECRLVEFCVDDSYVNSRGRKIRSSEKIKAYLLVPDAAKNGKCPALVMLHDHGARFDIGKEKLVRPIAGVLPLGTDDHIYRSSEQWTHKYFDGVHLADSLASLGYVVLVADALYWGERSSGEAQRWSELKYALPGQESLEADRSLVAQERKDTLKLLHKRVYEGQRKMFSDLSDRRVIWAEKILRDDIASVRLLSGLPYVDPSRVGAFGFSMGAHRCWLLSAFCPEVKCGVALSWMTTLDGYADDHASDLSMRIQPMRDYMDFGDIGAYLTPKSMLFLNGESDHLFPKEMVQKAFAKLHSHYKGAQCLRTEFFDGGHHCGKAVQKTIADYFDEQL